MTIRRLRLLLVAGVACCISIHQASAQLPQTRLYSVYPPGAQAGTTVDVNLASGEDLDEVDALHFTHPGITAVQKMQGAEGAQQPVANTFVVTVAADVPAGIYEAYCEGRFGASNSRRFVVGTREEVLEDDANNTPDVAKPLEIGKVLNGRADRATDIDWFRFTATAGQRIVFDCRSERIDSRMDPTLEIYDTTGRRRLEFARNVRGRDAVLVFEVPADGEYLLRVLDQTFSGGNDYFYRLTPRVGPYVAFVMPPAGLPGSNDTYTFYGYNLPGGERTGIELHGVQLERFQESVALPDNPALLDVDNRVTPVEAAMNAVSHRLETEEGLSNPVRIYLAEAPVVLEQEPNNEPAESQTVTVPCEIGGQFATVGDTDVYTFEAKSGEVYWIEAYGQRLGETVDPYFYVDQVTVDGDGNESTKRLGTQDDVGLDLYQNVFDTQTDDAVYRLQVPADGKYRVTIRDRYWETRGDPKLIYRLAIRPESPDFRLVGVPVAPAAGQAWPVGLRQGDNFAVNVLAFRQDAFNGPIDVTAENLPEGIACTGTTIGSNSNSAYLVFTTTPDAQPGWYDGIRLVGHARIDDPAAVKAVEAARQAVTDAEKPLADLRKAVETENEKVQQATAARDQAKTASEDNPDDENLKTKLQQAEEALQNAQSAQQEAVAKLQAAEQVLSDAQASLAQAETNREEAVQDLVRPVRSAAIVWATANNDPAQSRIADTMAVTVLPETAYFQIQTDVTRVQAHQGRQILVPVTLEKRHEFDAKVQLNFSGFPNGANIDAQNGAIEQGQTETVLRMFVKENSPPGVYTVWLNSQGQIAYRRNPERADRFKAEFDAATAEKEAAQQAATAATQAKNEAVQAATQAAEALMQAQTDLTEAQKNVETTTATLATAQEAKTAADKVATDAAATLTNVVATQTAAARTVENAQATVTSAEAAVTAAAEALEADPENEALKKQKAEADAALTAAQETLAKAQEALRNAQAITAEARKASEDATKAQEAAGKALSDAQTAKTAADEALTKAQDDLKTAQETNTAAQEAKTNAEAAEQAAQAAAAAAEERRKAAEKASNDADKAAQPQNRNYTPPSTPIIIEVLPAPVKLGANVPNSGNLKRGETLAVTVTVTRQNGFAGPVQLSLPLPPGVTGLTADEPTIAADQTEGVITITAAGDATEGQLANMVVRATMEQDGKAAVDVPIAVKVNP